MIPRVDIYTLTDPFTGQIRYVGKTVMGRGRLSSHLCEKGETHRHRWVKSLLLKGQKPVFEIIETLENTDDSTWREAERFWISYLRFLGFSLCNLDLGGHGPGVHSQETIDKLRSCRRTPEQRARISAALIGKKPSAETRRKLSQAKLGKPRSAATIAKIMAYQRTKKITPAHIAALAEGRRKAIQRDGFRKLSDEARINMSLGRQKAWETRRRNGTTNNGWKGRTHTQETIAKFTATRRLNESSKRAAGLPVRQPVGIESRVRMSESAKRQWAERRANGTNSRTSPMPTEVRHKISAGMKLLRARQRAERQEKVYAV